MASLAHRSGYGVDGRGRAWSEGAGGRGLACGPGGAFLVEGACWLGLGVGDELDMEDMGDLLLTC